MILIGTLNGNAQCGFSGLGTSYCESAPAVTMEPFNTGGVFSGPGVTGNQFSPSVAGPGSHQINYKNTNSYTVNTSGVFNFNGTATGWTTVTYAGGDLQNTDDALSNAINIGFPFEFFGNTYTQLYASSNGNITFTPYTESSYSPAIIPSTASPNNMIALARADLEPNASIISEIKYKVVGTAPNRTFILSYNDVPANGSIGYLTSQVKLFETSYNIEIHTTINSLTIASLQGIENSNGEIGVTVPSRNNQNWTANTDYVAFIPCSTSRTVEVYQDPTTKAGTGGSVCGIGSSNTFSLSAVASVGTGTWTQTSGAGTSTFSNVNSATSTVYASASGTYVYRWTEVNGSCEDYDEVTVVYDRPTTADAGVSSVEECDLNISLSGIQSVSGSSASWTVTSGNPSNITYSNSNIFNPSVTSSAYGTYVFELTETYGSCSSTDEITVTFTEQPISEAGTGGSVCGIGASNTFSLSAVASVGTGAWTQTSGPGSSTFSNANLATSTVYASTSGTYVYRWTEVNGSCEDYDEVTVVYDRPTTADAGVSSVEECDLNISLSGIQSVSGSSASWTVTSGNPSNITYSNSNIFNPSVTSSAYGTYVFELTETYGSCSSTDEITVTFTEQPISEAGTGGSVCGIGASNTFSLSAVASVGTGAWTQTSGPGSSTFSNANLATSTVYASTSGTYVYRWTEVNGSCEDYDEVTVVYDRPTTADAGATSVEECDLNISLSGIQSVSGSSASWTVTSGNPSNITFSNSNIFNPSVTSSAYGTYVFQLTETYGSCSSTDEITVTFTEQPVSEAGTGGSVCGIGASNTFSLSAVASVGTGTWTQTSGAGTSTFSNVNSATSTVYANTSGTYVYRWTEVNGSCEDYDEVTVVYDRPTTADAGVSSVEECDLNISLSGIQSVSGSSASWTVTSGNPSNVTFNNSNIFNPTVTASAYGTYVFQLIETYGSCISTDEITVTFTEQPISEAGTGGSVCGIGASNTFSLSAVASVGTGTGAWTQTSGPGSSTFSNVNSATSTVYASTSGTYVYRWTEVNGSCEDYDEVTVVYDRPTTADAGVSSVEECDLNISLSGIQSVSGSSASWTVTSGNPSNITFNNSNIFNPSVTSSAYGTYVFQLTETYGSCISTDEITVTFTEQPVSEAGTGGSVCGIGASNTFSLSAVASVGTGTWTQTSGAGTSTFSNVNSATSTVYANTSGSYVYRWTEVNGSCEDYDEVTVVYDRPTTADAGVSSVEECDLNITLAGIQSVSGSGASWTVTSGNSSNITFNNSNIFNPTVTASAYGTYVFQLTETYGSCISTDEITVTFTEQPVSEAGTGGSVCGIGVSNTFSLSAVASVGTGAWTQTSGPGGSTFGNVNSATSTVYASASGTYVYRWTEVNGSCEDYDEVTVVYDRPTTADAGASSVEECDLNISLSGIQSVSGSSASWTVTSGNPSNITFSNSNIFNPSATSSAYGTYVFQLTETYGSCSSTDEITVTFTEQPVSEAGTGGSVCGIGSSNTFSLSAVVSVGTGTWTQTSGPGSSTFSNANSATSTVYANTSGSYVYRWTEVNGSCEDYDEVTVVYDRPTTADAGVSSVEECDLNITLAGIQSVSGSGASWTVTSGNSSNITFNNSNIFNPTVTASAYGTYVFQLTETYGSCISTDEITVTFTEQPVSEAGTGGSVCGIGASNTFSLSAVASVGTGIWTQTSGPGSSTFSNANLATSTVYADAYGTYVYLWTEVNGSCEDYDEVTVVYDRPTTADAGVSSVEECDLNITLAGIQSVSGSSASWTVTSGNSSNITFNNSNIFNPTVTASAYGTYVFQLTETYGSCISTDEITVTFTEQPVSEAGTGGSVCGIGSSNTFSLSAVASVGTGTWTQTSGPGSSTFSNANLATSTVYADAYGTYVYLWTEVNGGCQDSDEIVVNFNESPQIISVDNDGNVYCEPASLQLRGEIGGGARRGSWTLESGGTGLLSASSITGSIITATYVPADGEYGELIFRLTTEDSDGAGPCTEDYAEISIVINQSAQVDAGSNIEICENEEATLGGSFSGATTSVTWTGGAGTFSDINDPLSTYEPSQAEIDAGSVTLTLQSNDPDGVGPCDVISDQVTITIHHLPEVALTGLNSNYAENDPVVIMEGFPSGGTYTGDGVNAGTNEFHPENALVGANNPNEVVYSYTDRFGCLNRDTVQVVVYPATEINFSIEDAAQDADGRYEVCANSGNWLLNGTPSDITGLAPTHFTSDNSDLITQSGGFYYLVTDNLVSDTYTITYTYTNSDNVTSVIQRDVKILPTQEVNFTVSTSCIEDTFEFEDDSFIPDSPFPSNVSRWQWNFGDGSATAAEEDPSHNYAAPGIYNVTLTSENDLGCAASITKEVRVGEKPDAAFIWSSICSNDATQFTDMTGALNISSYSVYVWNFGDGHSISGVPSDNIPAGTNDGKTSGTYKNPSHQYDEIGNFTVSLTVTTNDGCGDVEIQTVYILPFNTVTPDAENAYFEDFEESAGGWVASSNQVIQSDTSWVRGVANGEVINSEGNIVWWTGDNDSSYFNNEDSYLNGPCFDLSLLDRPMISLDVWYDLQDGFDGVVLQYSTDQGTSWANVGDINQGINWYNQQGIISSPGDTQDRNNLSDFNVGDKGWTGSSDGWLTARFTLDEIPVSERNLVRFRLAFASDANNPLGTKLNGFAFDNIYVGNKSKQVLIEHFVDTEVDISNQAIDHFQMLAEEEMNESGRLDFIMLEYHIADSGEDPLNADNQGDPSARSIYYGVSQAPTAVLDGNEFIGNPFEIDQVNIERRALMQPMFDIEVESLESGPTSLEAEVTITALKELSEDVIVHLAVVENDINIDGRVYGNVLKKLMFGGEGNNLMIDWVNGTSQVLQAQWEVNTTLYDNEKLYYVAFVQNRMTQEVYGAVRVKAPAKEQADVTAIDEPEIFQATEFNIYPNPASERLYFDLPQFNNEMGWKIVDQRGVQMDTGFFNNETDHEVDISGLSNGIYYVIVSSQDKPLIYKKIAIMNKK
ncbi:PKD domain-containing protein [Fulvivirga maritima]|uniref:PKD domain-containing protein n=1 Tax=Fulvivirga maritima TaxID=2904247 RepID=UPI001F3029F9|nr:PKD domain-containing protein [Fulvivirga maritima]UII25238.1 PKD domain-containing protein [Fulvivirga maritima]